MDSHGKGRKREEVVADRYRALGWTVWHPPRTKYRSQDIFSVGDLLCVKSNPSASGAHPSVFMVQVCDKKSVARHRVALRAWNRAYADVLPCCLWVWDKKNDKP